MDYILIIGMIALGVVASSFVAYKNMTDEIIEQQEKEIAAYKAENRRLQAAASLSNVRLYTKPVEGVCEIHYPNSKEAQHGKNQSINDFI